MRMYCVLAVVLLSACASTSSPTRMHYRLDAMDFSTSKPASSQSILIQEPKAHGILGSRPMVATEPSGALVQLDYNFWLESPRKLVHEKLTQWAEQRYSEVMPDKVYQNQYMRLESEITAFEKRQNNAVVGIVFTLKNDRGMTLHRKAYQQVQPLTGEGYAAFAQAVSIAVQIVLNNLEADITSCCSPIDS